LLYTCHPSHRAIDFPTQPTPKERWQTH
ncbi:hypothetical protein D043_2120B, partial [Vibrio parahaemolyticus EKP-021]